MSIAGPTAFPWQGDLTLSYTIRDAAGNVSDGQVTIPAPNAAPVTTPDTATVVSTAPAIIDVLANDSDPEGGVLTLVSAEAVSGTANITDDGMVSYTAPSALISSDTVTYAVQDPAGNTSQGTVAITVKPVQIAIDGETALGDFAVEAGEGMFEVSIIKPVEAAATYSVTTADLSSGPVLLEQGQISDGTAVGDTITATRGIWAGDESHGAMIFTQQWYRGDTAISGATGFSYVVTPADITEGLRFEQTVTNAAGSETIQTVVLEPTPVSIFTENGVKFNSARLLRNTDLAPANSQSVFYFVSLLPYSISRQGILRQDGVSHGVDIWEGQFRFRVPGATGFTRFMTVKQRTNVLAIATPNGSNTTVKTYSRFAGEDDWNLDSTVSGTGTVDLTFDHFAVSGAPNNTNQKLNAVVYRIACWSGVTPDASDKTVREQFLKADGTLEDPAVSRAAYGTPLVDLYGKAGDYAKGINNGSAGNFDLVEGTFTDA